MCEKKRNFGQEVKVREAIDRKLVLEDGDEYPGVGFGDGRDAVTEVVFNTSPVGYQEIVSDPSYTYQTVVFAYPLIGNYGIAKDDFETRTPTIGGLAVREYNDLPSNWRSEMTLGELMKKYGIPGISGIDTRRLVRSIRDRGSRMGILTGADVPTEEAVEKIRAYTPPHDAVSKVSRKNIEVYGAPDAKFHVVAVDCGMKENIVRCLCRKGCRVTVVPFDTRPAEVETLKPDGIFLSNGPGDPTDVMPVVGLVRALRGKHPMFGICLGHQMISLAYGGRTYKLKFGHRGGNHPVRDLRTGKIEMTSQNHSFAVDAGSLEGTDLSVTHVNILDGTVEGVECARDGVFSVQYHPESAPGPEDSGHLFDSFISLMEARRRA